MKKSITVIIIAFLFLAGYYYIYDRPVRLPEKDVFRLRVSCEERVPAGEKATVHMKFSNTGEYDYNITYSNDLFVVLLDGEVISPQDDGTTTIPIARGETIGDSCAVTLDKAGMHEITVKAAVTVEDDFAESKEYQYQESVMVNATA